MPIVLGGEPEEVVVPLVENGDYNVALLSFDANDNALDYPAGTSVSMLIDGTVTWNATVSGNSARFSIDASAVNAVMALGNNLQVVVFYENGTDKIPWYLGKTVNRR